MVAKVGFHFTFLCDVCIDETNEPCVPWAQLVQIHALFGEELHVHFTQYTCLFKPPIQPSPLRDPPLKMLWWNMNEVYFVKRYIFLSLLGVSTPPLSVWSLTAGRLSILLHHNTHTHTQTKDSTSHQSLQPLFLHFGVFVPPQSNCTYARLRSHTSTTVVSLYPTPASSLLLC